MDAELLGDELNFLLATETHGLVSHLCDAAPYLNTSTFAIWSDIQAMAAAGAEHARRLSLLLDQLEQPGSPSVFEPSVAQFHYTDLGHLLPLLVEEHRYQVAAYQRAIEHAGSDSPIQGVVDELADLLGDKQVELERLEQHHRKLVGGTSLAQRG